MSTNGTGCFGINKVTDIKKDSKGYYKVKVGVFNTSNINGLLVPKIGKELIDVLNNNEVLCHIKTNGTDVEARELDQFKIKPAEVCGILNNFVLENERSIQVLYADFFPKGSKSVLFHSLVEDEFNVIKIGYRVNGSVNYEKKRFTVNAIFGFQIVLNAIYPKPFEPQVNHDKIKITYHKPEVEFI